MRPFLITVPAKAKVRNSVVEGFSKILDLERAETTYTRFPVWRGEYCDAVFYLAVTPTSYEVRTSLYERIFTKSYGKIKTCVSINDAQLPWPGVVVRSGGNVTEENIFGAEPRSLALVNPSKQKLTIDAFNALSTDYDFRVYVGASHSPPTNNHIPHFIVETKDIPGEAIALGIISALSARKSFEGAFLIGRDFLHAPPKRFAVSHSVPISLSKYVTPSLLSHAKERTVGDLRYIMLPKELKEKARLFKSCGFEILKF